MPPRNVDSAPAAAPATASASAEPRTATPTGQTRIATVWPTSNFIVGDIVVTREGVELSSEQAELVFAAAESSSVKLVKKEGEVK